MCCICSLYDSGFSDGDVRKFVFYFANLGGFGLLPHSLFVGIFSFFLGFAMSIKMGCFTSAVVLLDSVVRGAISNPFFLSTVFFMKDLTVFTSSSVDLFTLWFYSGVLL